MTVKQEIKETQKRRPTKKQFRVHRVHPREWNRPRTVCFCCEKKKQNSSAVKTVATFLQPFGKNGTFCECVCVSVSVCVRLIGAQPCGSWWRCWRCCSRSRPVLQKVRHGGARSFAVNLFKLLIWHDKNGTECTPSVVIPLRFTLSLFKTCTPHPGR